MRLRGIFLIFIFVILINSISAAFGYDSSTDNYGYNKIQPSITGTTTLTGGNITTFLELLDTPSSYTGEGGNCVAVNIGETELEFTACGGVGSEVDPLWTGNSSQVYNKSNPFEFYNSTTLPAETDPVWTGDKSDYFTIAEILGFSYFNATNPPSSSSIGYFVNYTPVTTVGNITNGTLKGYPAANNICDIYYDGSHMCQIGEILNSISANQTNTNFTATFWASEGAPGYLANANDCDGWTSQTGTYLGSIWVGSTSHLNTYGSGSLVACSAARAIACCR